MQGANPCLLHLEFNNMKKKIDVGMQKGSLKCEKCGGKFAARVDGMCIECNDKEEKNYE